MIKRDSLPYVKQNAQIDILDSTRIHPELYLVAKRMAKSALDNSEDPDVVEKAMAQPDKIRDLDLDQFSSSVESLVERDYRNLFYFTAGELENPH